MHGWRSFPAAIGLMLLLVLPDATAAPRHLLLVRGAVGNPAFEPMFDEIQSSWKQAAERAGDVIVRRAASKTELRQRLLAVPAETTEELWIILVGHGTDDGRTAKFNLVGEDVSASELATWLQDWNEPLVLVNNASASGPFIPALSRPGRVLVTATQSGHEVYVPRFGLEMARALGSRESDLDRDGAVSVLEATVFATDRVQASYERERKLVSEHALVDDNGDGKGTRADWFEGLKPTRKPKGDAEPDGRRARQLVLERSRADRQLTEEQRRRRDELERELDRLRERRSNLDEETFFRQAEEVLLQLGRIYGSETGAAEEEEVGGADTSG